ncbi:ATP-dependent RNA helicase, partial [Puccinia graminis f. sp. tritici]
RRSSGPIERKTRRPIDHQENSLIIRSKANHQHRPRKINNCFIKDPQVIKNFLSNQNHSHLVGLDRSVNALNELS